MSDTTVEPGLAAWLKSEALYVEPQDDSVVAKWGDRATSSEFMSPLAYRSGAILEAARQLGFLSGPLARDEHTIAGLHSELVGQIIVLSGDRYGYEAAPTVFVLRAQENEASDTTALSVLYRFPDIRKPGFRVTANGGRRVTADGQPRITGA